MRHQLRHTSASVLYLRNQALSFAELGTLDASADANTNDGCRASCVDWYGNSRPLFIRNRVFALMGYEIVEGQLGRDGHRRGPARQLFAVRRISSSTGLR